jgi:hypothetical protein|tara:strand:+ start:48 stop:158 length:111 start_codon:yes stop_codon:yes gene_type:complete
MSLLSFVGGFIVGTLFGWKILNWLAPKILELISGVI